MDVIYVFQNSPGIGDNIRGLITLLQIQQIINKKINIYVDFSLHAFNNNLSHTLPDDKKVKNNTICRFLDNHSDHNELINFLLNNKNEKVYINTNKVPDQNKITEDIKETIKNLFEFNEDFENLFNNSLNKLPKNFDVYHYRLGDEVFNNDTTNFDNIVESFNNREKQNDIFLISDSLNLKNKIYETYKNNKVFVFLEQPHHTCDNSNDVHTLIEFFLITKAKNIYCYSNYFWISNFVSWSSYIYNIKLINIKN